MNKYRLKMKTLSGRGIEYITLYATSNFERYLLEHNLKYVRDISQDYQLSDKFNHLQQENKQLKENWNKLKEWLNGFHKLSEFEQWEIVKKMQELENGDSNE